VCFSVIDDHLVHEGAIQLREELFDVTFSRSPSQVARQHAEDHDASDRTDVPKPADSQARYLTGSLEIALCAARERQPSVFEERSSLMWMVERAGLNSRSSSRRSPSANSVRPCMKSPADA